jgi:DNA-binding beta-propeller fold protein YncE
MKTRWILALLISTLVAAPCAAKREGLAGVLAASVGDTVVLVEPNTGAVVGFDTGPVGWLFPAPGGILFAPDVVNNRTTVINLRDLTVVDRLDGLTMPHFGTTPDRYTAITQEIVLLSYPDRAVMARIDAEVSNPWQVIVAPDDAAVLILERLPDASTGIHLTTVNLINRQVVYRRALRGDIRHMALSPQLGFLALTDAASGKVHLVEPSTFTPMASRPTGDRPVDVVFTGDGKTLVTAVDSGNGAGRLDVAVFKIGKKGHRLVKEHVMPLAGDPARVAVSPGGDFVAVALEGGSIAVVDIKDREVIATHSATGTVRDLRWCDPAREGPMVPEWSDGEPEPPDFGSFVPKIKDGESSGLEEPAWDAPPN